LLLALLQDTVITIAITIIKVARVCVPLGIRWSTRSLRWRWYGSRW
jgi:hypothetical protein